ncbi:hypothetical protein [Achromobacter phage Motura]|uniref:Uncharacterized protein n=1 Tax=Achromobacter phage Motura TaxID=2591403 RepID=A0A514CT77_9CAUD|nr:hypothetical protein H1O15_gp270 [Achromobacter phage Motura]QDH83691.1 hypothetical protein [Achromobacter phage Motura]
MQLPDNRFTAEEARAKMAEAFKINPRKVMLELRRAYGLIEQDIAKGSVAFLIRGSAMREAVAEQLRKDGYTVSLCASSDKIIVYWK